MLVRKPPLLLPVLAGAYTLLTIYVSLHPLSGWRDSSVAPLAFVVGHWPRYVTTFDLVANALAYAPLGFLWAALLLHSRQPRMAFIIALMTAFAISLGNETAQNYLPGRVPSNIDLACNVLGAAIGAAIGVLRGGRLPALLLAWREQRCAPGIAGDAGLLLLLLWLLTQLNPEAFLFAGGDLRRLFGFDFASPFAADSFTVIEIVVVACETLAIAMIASSLAVHHVLLSPLVLIVLALALKSSALLLLMSGVRGMAWATPGALSGLALGLICWFSVALAAPRRRQLVAFLALLLAVVLVNLAPPNPDMAASISSWRQGHFLNFNGLTRLTTALWPYFALLWLLLARKER